MFFIVCFYMYLVNYKTINVTSSNDQWGQTYLIEGQAIGPQNNTHTHTHTHTDRKVQIEQHST